MVKKKKRKRDLAIDRDIRRDQFALAYRWVVGLIMAVILGLLSEAMRGH